MSSVLGQINDLCITPQFFLLVALWVKCLLVSIYCILIVGGLRFIRNRFHNYMGARRNYYVWYFLLLSFPLSSLGWNDFVKMPIYRAVHQEWRVVLFVAVVIWVSVSIFRLTRFMVLTLKIKKLIAVAKPYRDIFNLKLRATNTVGLQAERIHIVAVRWIGSPVSYGLFKKTILLPADYEKRYTQSELYLLLLHEMVHIKNHDTVKLHCISFVTCFIWVLHLFEKYFKRDVEILCDNQVMSLQEGARNAYGELLVKECAARPAAKGLSFSDSYQTIASRLDALYRFKPEKRSKAVILIVVLFALFTSFLWSYHNPAGWFIPNDLSYKEFDVNIMLAETNALGELEYAMIQLPVDVARGVYTVSDNELQVDIQTLCNAVRPYRDAGQSVEEIWFQSIVYSMDMGMGAINPVDTAQAYVEYALPYSELEHTNEDYRRFPLSQEQNGSKFIYSLIARWL